MVGFQDKTPASAGYQRGRLERWSRSLRSHLMKGFGKGTTFSRAVQSF
jgi:hypothetical protein